MKTNTNLGLCKKGHDMGIVGVYVNPTTKGSTCRECMRINRNRHMDRSMYGGNREKVIQRDGEKCLVCGMHRTEHKKLFGRDITVDHIDKMGTQVPFEKKNNSMENLQTLCIVHHMRKDNTSRKLTPKQRVEVGATDRSTPMKDVVEKYGVSIPRVTVLRRRYKEELAKGVKPEDMIL